MQLKRIIFVVSLGLNFFIAGWWLGGLWRQPPPPGPINFTTFLQHRLDPSTFYLIRKPLAEVDAVMDAGFKVRRKTFKKLREVLLREPYNPQAVESLLAELSTQRFANEQKQWRLVGMALAKLSAGERKSFARIVFPQHLGPPPPPGSDQLP